MIKPHLCVKEDIKLVDQWGEKHWCIKKGQQIGESMEKSTFASRRTFSRWINDQYCPSIKRNIQLVNRWEDPFDEQRRKH